MKKTATTNPEGERNTQRYTCGDSTSLRLIQTNSEIENMIPTGGEIKTEKDEHGLNPQGRATIDEGIVDW
jgi:hypothetical protein